MKTPEEFRQELRNIANKIYELGHDVPPAADFGVTERSWSLAIFDLGQSTGLIYQAMGWLERDYTREPVSNDPR